MLFPSECDLHGVAIARRHLRPRPEGGTTNPALARRGYVHYTKGGFDMIKHSFAKSIGLVLALMGVSAGAANSPTDLAGPAFTDPDYVLPMPEAWQKQAIQYKEWAASTDLAVTLDQQLYPALLDLISQYGKDNKLKIAVQEGTCGISSNNLNDKSADIAGFCCPAGEADRLPGLKFHTLGISAISILAHASNPVDNLTTEQARDVFQGKLYRWSQLKSPEGKPGPKKAIQVLGRLHCKQRPGHWRLILDNEDQFSPRMNDVSAIRDMITGIARDPFSVGFETLIMKNRYDTEGAVKSLAVNGIKPEDSAQVAQGNYPFYRTYNLTTWETPETTQPHAQALVKYIFKNLDKIDPKYWLVPVSQLQQHGWQFRDGELIGGPEAKEAEAK